MINRARLQCLKGVPEEQDIIRCGRERPPLTALLITEWTACRNQAVLDVNIELPPIECVIVWDFRTKEKDIGFR